MKIMNPLTRKFNNETWPLPERDCGSGNLSCIRAKNQITLRPDLKNIYKSKTLLLAYILLFGEIIRNLASQMMTDQRDIEDKDGKGR